MSSKVSASISISGENLDFDECTEAIGIAPTSTFVRPFDYDSSVIPLRQWSVEIPKTTVESIDDAVRLLLDQLSEREEKLANFAANHGYEVAVSCGVSIYEDRPLFELTRPTLQVLARLNARFSMDIVDYSED